jgi:hypothetical protein
MKNIHRTLIFALSVIVVISVLTFYMQLTQQESVNGCSYLDPIIVDILAFSVAVFLVIEAFARIFEHPSASIKRQFTRLIRIGIGTAIITIHVMQFIHK